MRVEISICPRPSGTGPSLGLDGSSSLRGVWDNRSCVAKAEPKKRLCGITVAPIIPIANGELIDIANFTIGNRALTCIQTPRLKNRPRRDVAEERLSPVHLYLGDDDEHANQDGKDLEGG